MSRFNDIKEKYANERGYNEWIDYVHDKDLHDLDWIYEEIASIYAHECSQASLEKASENVTIDENFSEVNINHWIDKESITQKSNIVIL